MFQTNYDAWRPSLLDSGLGTNGDEDMVFSEEETGLFDQLATHGAGETGKEASAREVQTTGGATGIWGWLNPPKAAVYKKPVFWLGLTAVAGVGAAVWYSQD
jgi:hypothetical protein